MKTITVKGIGTASTKPDYISVKLKISSKDDEYSKSVEDANERIALLQNAVCSAGFEKEDLKTLAFNVRTNYESVPDKLGRYHNKFSGYICIYQLKLSFDLSTKKLAETLNAISQSGANAELSIAFTVKDPEKVSAALLKSASENARRKAEILCEASGARLGGLISINYDWSDINIVSASAYSMDNGLLRGVPAAGSAPEFEPEDIMSNDSASFVWEIN